MNLKNVEITSKPDYFEWLLDVDNDLTISVRFDEPGTRNYVAEGASALVETDASSEASEEMKQKRKLGTVGVRQSMKPSTKRKCVRWTEREDIFLTGIVLDMYCLRHSLKPTKAEKMQCDGNLGETGELVWREIHDTYQHACDRYFELHGHKTPPRTLKALQKRWTETGHQMYEASATARLRLTKRYLALWDEYFNRDFKLTNRSSVV